MTRSVLAHWSVLQRKLAGVPGEESLHPSSTVWQPNTDVYDGPDGLVVKVELAGVPCDSLLIYLESGALVVEGERRDPFSGESVAGLRLRQMEIDYGPFQRVIPLPYPVDWQGALSHCADGVLEIRLPRADAAVRKRIVIVLQG